MHLVKYILSLKFVNSLKCYSCKNGVFDRDCKNEENFIECKENESCMTEMRQENGQVRITKGCKQNIACEQHVTFDYNTCTDNPMTRLCFECCQFDFCNSNMYLPPLFENNPCGVTKIRPFLNLDKPEFADEMWAGLNLKRKKRALENENKTHNFDKSVKTVTSPLTLTSMPTVNIKLAGGREVIPGSWSWVVQIKRDISNKSEFICAGTLIHKNWVLTAAQCIHTHHPPFDFYEVQDIYSKKLINHMKILMLFLICMLFMMFFRLS